MTTLEREDAERLAAEVCRAVHDVAGAVRLLAWAGLFAATMGAALLGLFILGLAGAF